MAFYRYFDVNFGATYDLWPFVAVRDTRQGYYGWEYVVKVSYVWDFSLSFISPEVIGL